MSLRSKDQDYSNSTADFPFSALEEEVIKPGLCTHCGTCVGLSKGQLRFVRSDRGPLPRRTRRAEVRIPELAWLACPGRGLNYPDLNSFIHGSQPDSWLVGEVVESYLGYSGDPSIRRDGASAGVITSILAELVASGELDGAIVLKHGHPEPWLSTPIIARTREEVLASSQSVYIPIPVNTILQEVADFTGKLGYVGLPDQVASIRRLQQGGHPAAAKIDLIIGPYVGTSMYHSALSSFLRSHGGYGLDDIVELKYREGEWPGYLMIRLRDGTVLRSAKFYYNYLIPFFITQASLLTMDFMNELTDISVGDAWSPELEGKGEGFSVVLSRSAKGDRILQKLSSDGVLVLERIQLTEALSMHGHMLDFKKRGAFLRGQFRRWLRQPAPKFSLRPRGIGLTRYLVELFISGLFAVGRTGAARMLVEWIPTSLLGPLFELLRQRWKQISKPAKREGIWSLEFDLAGDWEEQSQHG